MARTNARFPTAGSPGPVTHEGAPAARINPEQQLRRSVMACMLWEDTFYEDGNDIVTRIAEAVTKVKPEVAAAIALEARSKMYLRHVPLMICRVMAAQGTLQKEHLAAVIQRPDELTEFLSMYWMDGKVPVANSVKKGLALAFQKFDEYQLAKWGP